MKKRCIEMLLILATMVLLGGCSISGTHPDLDDGMAKIEELNYKEALDSFQKARKNGEDEELVSRGEGIAYIGMIQYDEAAKAFEQSLSSSSGYITDLELDTNYYLALSYYKGGKIDEAIRVYNAILDYDKRQINALYLRGTMELEKDQYENAISDFESAMEMNPKDYDCLVDIYSSLEKNGHKEEGLAYLKNVLDRDESIMSDYDKGRLYYYLEDYENARNALESARSNENADIILYLGLTYEMLGDYNYASSVYDSFLQKDQTRPEIYNQLGLCKMKKGAYEEALTALDSGLAIENNEYLQTLKFNEITAYEYLGDFKKAAVLMESYLGLYPDDEDAKREYEFLKTR